MILLSPLGTTIGCAQADPIAAIRKIYSAYNTNNGIRFSGSMKMYNKNDPGKIIEQIQSSYVIKGANFSCRIGPVLMLLNDDYYVSSDKTIKLLMVGRRKDLSGTGQIPVLNTGQLKTWIEEKAMRATLTEQGSESILQINDEQGISGYRLFRLRYSNASGYIKNILMEIDDHNDPARKTMILEINYTIPIIIADCKDIFSEKAFFSIVNKTIRVTENYKTYQLINQL